MYLTAPRYSFVQPYAAADDACTTDTPLCLPVSAISHLSFYLRGNDLDTLSMFESDSFMPYVTIVAPDADCSPGVQSTGPFTGPAHYIEAADSEDNAGTHVELYNTSVHGSMGMWFNFVPYLIEEYFREHIAIGECFKFQVVVDCRDVDRNVTKRYTLGCTNCFRRVDAGDCYTSVVKYRNPADAFDFPYTHVPTFYSSVELPLYLRDPVMENEQKVYTKSDGTLIKLYERKEEVYTLETDHMPYAWHKALDIALSHDDVSVINSRAATFDPVNTATQFIKKENYEIEYNKAPLSTFGKGSCKLSNASPIHLVNNNCA